MYYYARQEWRTYRVRCIEAVDGLCQMCGRGKDDGKTMQVHHPYYVRGRKPWEYPIEHCVVLCRGCHAEQHGLIMPRDGWTVLYSDLDSNSPQGPFECENCSRDIMWLVTIYHPEWGDAIVGTECAENLSLGSEMVALKSYHRRLTTFVSSPRWGVTPKGFKIHQKGHNALVFAFRGGYRIKIGDDWGRITFDTIEAAKHRIFEVIEHRESRRLATPVGAVYATPPAR